MKTQRWESGYETVFNNITDDEAIKMYYPARIRNNEASVKWNRELNWNGTLHENSLNSTEVSTTAPHYAPPFPFFMFVVLWILIANNNNRANSRTYRY